MKRKIYNPDYLKVLHKLENEDKLRMHGENGMICSGVSFSFIMLFNLSKWSMTVNDKIINLWWLQIILNAVVFIRMFYLMYKDNQVIEEEMAIYDEVNNW